MADPARRLATYQDVLDAPDGMTAEILGGELHVSPRPASGHGYAEGRIGFDLMGPFMIGRGGPGGWWILREPELHLGEPDPTSVVAAPDLAGWRRERMPVIPDVAAFTLAPDWVCEILSPGAANARRDRVKKPAEYAKAGIPWFWLVDPRERLLEVRHLRGGVYAVLQTFAGDDRVRAQPFDAVELDLAGWWLPA
jgi:hypothetical protein